MYEKCDITYSSYVSVTEHHSVHEKLPHHTALYFSFLGPKLESFPWIGDRRNQAMKHFQNQKSPQTSNPFHQSPSRASKISERSHPWITHKRGFFLSIALWILTKDDAQRGHASWILQVIYPHVAWVNAKGKLPSFWTKKRPQKVPLQRFKKKTHVEWGSSWWFVSTPLKNMLVKLDHLPQGSGWKKNLKPAPRAWFMHTPIENSTNLLFNFS